LSLYHRCADHQDILGTSSSFALIEYRSRPAGKQLTWDLIDPLELSMGSGLLESKHSVAGETAENNKPAASAVADTITKEEEAEQDAKLRPEREAKFTDYIVSTACNFFFLHGC
jgi:hypothetical protein